MNNWMRMYHRQLKELGLLRDEQVCELLEIAVLSDDKQTYDDIGELLDIRINMALLNNDPFMPYPSLDDLGDSGIFIGNHNPTGIPFHWGHEDQRFSLLMLGSPGAGKTNLAYWIIEALITE